MNTKLLTPALIIVILLAALAGWAFGNNSSNRNAEESIPTATTTPNATGTPSLIIEPVGPVAEAPNLNRPINISANLSKEAAAKAVARIKELNDELRSDGDLYSSWLDLALQRKLIGDHVAAEEIWIYITKTWVDDPIAHNNLADLYLMAFHDNDQAETYLLKAISKDPTQMMFYENAYSFYRFVKKDLVRAREILEEGITRNPSNAEGLRKLLADLKAAS